MSLKARKLKHVEVCLNYPVNYTTRTTGLERFDLPYCALPESDFAVLDTRTTFLGKTLSAPILIGAMTGGAELSASINKNLALAAEALGLGLMLGSQRVMLEQPNLRSSFAVRSYAPNILLIGNLGLAQLNKGYGPKEVLEAINSIEADALAFHTNPLQEALQHGGDTHFSGIISKLHNLVPKVPQPLLLKEVGHGLSGKLALEVKHAGFAALDVAGAGGTSWARVEDFVNYGTIVHPDLVEWGIPTATALQEVHAALPDMPLIASGGIRSGLDIAKSLALGAEVAALAKPLLKPATVSAETAIAVLEKLIFELRVAMHCTGSKTIADLKRLELRSL